MAVKEQQMIGKDWKRCVIIAKNMKVQQRILQYGMVREDKKAQGDDTVESIGQQRIARKEYENDGSEGKYRNVLERIGKVMLEQQRIGKFSKEYEMIGMDRKHEKDREGQETIGKERREQERIGEKKGYTRTGK